MRKRPHLDCDEKHTEEYQKIKNDDEDDVEEEIETVNEEDIESSGEDDSDIVTSDDGNEDSEDDDNDGSNSEDDDDDDGSNSEDDDDDSEDENSEENESDESSEDEKLDDSEKNCSKIKKIENEESSVTALENITKDEYEEDSSDEEDARNTIGNIPIEWYKAFEHIGYDLEGKKILKDGKNGDEIDDFIRRMEDPNYWREVRDRSTNKNVVLSDEDIKLIRKFVRGRYTEKSVDPHPTFDEPFIRETMIHPVTNQPEHKRSFIPSKWERLKVSQLVHSMKMGWIKLTDKKSEDEEEEEKDKMPKFYDLWGTDFENERKRSRLYIAPPKMSLPGHAESYNPPPEYLFTPEEEKKWRETDPSERRMNFIPQKFKSLREVPGYKMFVKERFERCLDLYLCPRQMKMKAHVKSEDLLPKLPNPRDLQPFPTIQSLIFRGHSHAVRSITLDPWGNWMASGSDDCTIKFWDVRTARCIKTLQMDGPVASVKWHPKRPMLAAVVDKKLFIISTLLAPQADDLSDLPTEINEEEKSKVPVTWNVISNSSPVSVRLSIEHPKPILQMSWQNKGDYFAVVMKEGQSLSVLLHRLSTSHTISPLSKAKGLVQSVAFHPSKPILYVATQQFVRVYDLMKQCLTKKYFANCKWISSMAVHPRGENFIIGSYDARISWFENERSEKPYKTLKYHKSAVRQVTYHKTLPLFASCSDDGSTIISHGMVYNDFTTDPLIVPVKILRGHLTTDSLGVLDCIFHPNEPWLISAGADHTIRLYS